MVSFTKEIITLIFCYCLFRNNFDSRDFHDETSLAAHVDVYLFWLFIKPIPKICKTEPLP